MNNNALNRPASRRAPPATYALLPAMLAVAVLFCGGCITKHYTVNQYGLNHVDAEVLKEYEIQPQLKASLK